MRRRIRAWLRRVVPGDRGSGALWVLAVSMVAVLGAAGVAVRGLAAVTRHRAETAADFAALAAALHASDGVPTACREARRVAILNGAMLASCRLSGAIATIRVTAPLPAIGNLPRFKAHADARAGPAP